MIDRQGARRCLQQCFSENQQVLFQSRPSYCDELAIAITIYREMVKFFGDRDSTSRLMTEEILTKEEEHADELADLLFAVEPQANNNPHRLYFPDEKPDTVKKE